MKIDFSLYSEFFPVSHVCAIPRKTIVFFFAASRKCSRSHLRLIIISSRSVAEIGGKLHTEEKMEIDLARKNVKYHTRKSNFLLYFFALFEYINASSSCSLLMLQIPPVCSIIFPYFLLLFLLQKLPPKLVTFFSRNNLEKTDFHVYNKDG